MREIKLSKYNLVMLVDDSDYPLMSQMAWQLVLNTSRTAYAKATIGGKRVLAHHIILPLPDSKLTVDHINGNGLDNQRSNLRLATRSQQQMNKGKISTKTTSRFKGVRYDARRDRWQARIKCKGVEMHLGNFMSSEGAARAYNKAAQEHFGDFAKLNEVPNA